MSYNVVPIAAFQRQVKRILKKFPSLKKDLEKLTDSISENPFQGKPLGKNCFKIRLAISSKAKGKSGGARVITNIAVKETTVFLLSIYDKSEQENISPLQILELLKQIEE